MIPGRGKAAHRSALAHAGETRYPFLVVTVARRYVKEAVFGAIPKSRLVRRGPATTRRVSLTFDDGPDPMTSRYLDLLDELGVPATFFVLGLHCERYPELAKEYVRRGHQVASHGYDHQRFPSLSWSALHDQLERTDAVLGPQPIARSWVRPPYGKVDARVLGQLIAFGSTIALWSLDSHDYEVRNTDDLVARCAPENVTPGEVILLHEGQQWTLDALPRIVLGLRGAGYEMVTMADLFAE
jgi:peptidoglycan/xylan/chitin deacetylase (PgdA/CDA1 family)